MFKDKFKKHIHEMSPGLTYTEMKPFDTTDVGLKTGNQKCIPHDSVSKWPCHLFLLVHKYCSEHHINLVKLNPYIAVFKLGLFINSPKRFKETIKTDKK